MPEPSISVRIYRRLLRLYPAAFREEYGEQMEQDLAEELAEASGPAARTWLWMRLIFDVASSLPAQVAREAASDARHALRQWGARPWHTAFLIAALALGIGAATGVFSVVNALLLRSLPFADADRLAALESFQPPHDTAAQFDEWRTRSEYLADAALYEDFDFNIGQERMIRAHVARTSANFFELLGARPALGRIYTAGDADCAVISYGLWQQLFGGSERALGASLHVDDARVTVIGVAPPDFEFPNKASVWRVNNYSRGNNGWSTIARLKSGVSWEQARAAFAVEAPRLWPLRYNPADPHVARMVALRDRLAGPVKQASLLLLAAVGIILLIACANVANVMLARTADRGQEFAIRSALGATRARIVQQLLTECLLLAVVSAVAGVVAAGWITRVAARLHPGALASQTYTLLDWRVLLFCVATALGSTVLFGLLPSLAAGRAHAFAARGSGGLGRSRWIREGLVLLQVALTVVLLSGSISVGQAFGRLMQTDRGFDTRNPVTVSVSIQGTRNAIKGNELAYFNEALARIRRIPGVEAASATEFLPLTATGFVGGPFGLDGQRPPGSASMMPIFADYFRAMGAPVLHGREFTEADIRGGAEVAIVNEAFARQFTEPSQVVGRMLTIGRRSWKIVGVVKPMDYMTEWLVGEGDHGGPQVFVPSRNPGPFMTTFVARVSGTPAKFVAPIRAAVQSVDPAVPVDSARTMSDRLDAAFARPRFYRTAMLFFASFAVLLAVIGIHGVVSYSITRRTHEMGVRLAIGSTPGRLRRMLLREASGAVAAGLLAGMALSLVSSRILGSLFEGAGSTNAWTWIASGTLILATAIASIRVATRRIARLDVMEILRVE